MVSTSFQAPEQSLHDFLTLFVLRSKPSINFCCVAPLTTPTSKNGLLTGKKKKFFPVSSSFSWEGVGGARGEVSGRGREGDGGKEGAVQFRGHRELEVRL